MNCIAKQPIATGPSPQEMLLESTIEQYQTLHNTVYYVEYATKSYAHSQHECIIPGCVHVYVSQ